MTQGYIYLIENQAAGIVKIGYSSNPESRLRTLQTAAPNLKMVGYRPGTLRDEKYAHSKFKNHHYAKEWYQDSKEIRKYFNPVIPKWKYYFVTAMITAIGVISFASQWSH